VSQTPPRDRDPWAALSRIVSRALSCGADALQRTWRALPRRRVPCVEVMLADDGRARAIQRDVRLGMRRLRRALGSTLLRDVSVIVQQTVGANEPPYELLERDDESYQVVIRLPLNVDGRTLVPDELLATLADRCIFVERLHRLEPIAEVGQWR
jgi:hypothetical protein